MKKTCIILLLFSFLLCTQTLVKGAPLMIEKGNKVQLDYVLYVNDEVVDSSKDKKPLEYTHGEGQIIAGLEKQLLGLKVGDKKTVSLTAEEGYGPIDEQAYQEVPRTLFPPDIDLKVGMLIPLKDKEGRTVPVLVHEIKEEAVVLDFNHPLAGKNLKFEITVVSVE